MDENMMNNIDTEKRSSGKINKTWRYSEQMSKHVVEHTISVHGNRFTHVSQVNETSKAMKKRSDISLQNIRSVSSYYGYSRNMAAVIALALLATIFLIAGIVIATSEGVMIVLAIMLALAILFGVLAYSVYNKKKPSFVLQLETYEDAKYVINEKIAHGNTIVDFGKKKISNKLLFLMIILPPVGLCYLLFKSNKSRKYKFQMDSDVGYDIVNTLGDLI